jgi:hypothetical protein
MDLSIIEVFGQNVPRKLRGKVFAIRLSDGVEIYPLLVAMSEVLASWADDGTWRDIVDGHNAFEIWTDSGRYALNIQIRGELMFVAGIQFADDMLVFLQQVEEMLPTVTRMLEQDRATTRRVEIPPEALDSARTYFGRHMTVGTDSRHVPPPLPTGPTFTPVPQPV